MFSHGKFNKPGATRSTGEKGPKPVPTQPLEHEHDKEHGPTQAAHGGSVEKHVTETHPGQTQPHPETGVHAFAAHHIGGGKYRSHTHHDGGNVETREHGSSEETKSAHDEAFPSSDMDQQAPGGGDTASQFSDALGGIGGDGEMG